MIQAAAERGWIDGERVMMESLLGIRRAGRRRDHHLFCARGRRRCFEQGWVSPQQ